MWRKNEKLSPARLICAQNVIRNTLCLVFSSQPCDPAVSSQREILPTCTEFIVHITKNSERHRKDTENDSWVRRHRMTTKDSSYPDDEKKLTSVYVLSCHVSPGTRGGSWPSFVEKPRIEPVEKAGIQKGIPTALKLSEKKP